MELYVLRHAIAADAHGKMRDADRPLTDEGETKFRRAARAFGALEVKVDAILTSPFLRAAQTAEIAAAALGIKPTTTPALASGAQPSAIIELLAASEHERVMIVGHEPDLGAFVATLVGGSNEGGVTMRKGGLARLTVESWRPPRARLQWLLWPRHMRALAQ